jgi:FlaA1/EpsC-like NDP-sugar epimerase
MGRFAEHLLPRALVGENRIRRIHARNFAIYLNDVAMAFAAFVVAYLLRPNVSATWADIFAMAGAFAAVAAVVYTYTGLYRHVWEYVSLKDAVNIVKTATVVVLVFLPALFFITRLEELPRSMLVSSWLMLVMFLAAPRLGYRLMRDHQLRGLMVDAGDGTAVLLLGAGPEAEQFIRAVERNPHSGLRTRRHADAA